MSAFSLLEELCRGDTELLFTLSRTMLVEPLELHNGGIDTYIENAQKFEKKKDFLNARFNYKLAGEIALYKGKLAQVQKLFKKCAELEARPEYKKIFTYYSKKTNAEKALKIAREYYTRRAGAHEDEIYQPPVSGVTKEKPATEHRNWKVLAKYFVHGLAFSVIMIFLVFLWSFVLAFLVVAGAFIGLIIGLLVLFFILGGLNSFLTEEIWSISTRTGWMSLLGHGVVLFIALIIAHIPSIIINLTVPSLPMTIVLFIAEAFIDGFVAKNVAGFWEE